MIYCRPPDKTRKDMTGSPFKIIARMRSDFPDKFGVPRQSNLVPGLEAAIVFEPEYRNADALRGLEEFSHLWLIWEFTGARREGWSPTVRPPRLGGNARLGVFATRSPFRPSPVGLSSVRIRSVSEDPELGPLIHVSGADLVDGTPIFDIKPYLPFTDSHPEARAGFAAEPPDEVLEVIMGAGCSGILPPEKEQALRGLLALDPRPPYHSEPGRVYGLRFGGFEVKFSVREAALTVLSISPE